MSDHDLTDDALTGGFRIYQRRRGHRYSLDDVLTAFCALQAAGGAARCLDLGCGIGSVLLMLAYKLPGAQLLGVEAQEQSFELARRNVLRNQVSDRVSLLRGDFRHDPDLPPGPFDLITGTPPYQPLGQGTVSPDSQRAHARVELRGGVEDYLEAAEKRVASAGAVVVCGDARKPQRVERTAERVGLHIHAVVEAVPAVRKGPLFSVWTLRRSPATAISRQTFLARESDGGRSQAYRDVRAYFDLGASEDEPKSPLLRKRQAAAAGDLS